MENVPLQRITFFDKVNASALGRLTSESSSLRRLRQKNGYSQGPTFPKPICMGLEKAEVGGVMIRYSRVINPGKPKLVLLSPFPQSIVGYAPIWQSLTKHYDVLAYDMPGFGMSDGGGEFMNFQAQGYFLMRVLEHFQLQGVHLLGPDVGMPTVLYHVASLNHRVKSIIIGDGPGVAPPIGKHGVRKAARSALWWMTKRFARSGALIEAGTRICNVNYTPNEYELSDYKMSYRGRVATVMEWFKLCPDTLAVLDPLLEDVDVPALVFWGEQDALLDVDHGRRLHQRLPNSQLKIFANCGHFAYQDQHEEFVKMLQTWIQEREAI